MAIVQHIGRWGSAAVGRNVEHALEGRAAWAPLVATGGLGVGQVVGAYGGCGQATSDLRMLDGLVRHCVRQAVSQPGGAKRRRVASEAGPEASLVQRVDAIRDELKADIAQVAEVAAGALVAVRSTVTKVGHLVKVAGRAVHPREWETHCGWRFGSAPHESCCVAEVTCRRACAAALRQVGLVTGRGTVVPTGQGTGL